MSERGGSDIGRLWNWISRSSQNRMKMRSFKFRVVLCRIRLFPPLISKIKWLGSELPLIDLLIIVSQEKSKEKSNRPLKMWFSCPFILSIKAELRLPVKWAIRWTINKALSKWDIFCRSLDPKSTWFGGFDTIKSCQFSFKWFWDFYIHCRRNYRSRWCLAIYSGQFTRHLEGTGSDNRNSVKEKNYIISRLFFLCSK